MAGQAIFRSLRGLGIGYDTIATVMEWHMRIAPAHKKALRMRRCMRRASSINLAATYFSGAL